MATDLGATRRDANELLRPAASRVGGGGTSGPTTIDRAKSFEYFPGETFQAQLQENSSRLLHFLDFYSFLRTQKKIFGHNFFSGLITQESFVFDLHLLIMVFLLPKREQFGVFLKA